jgi:hypothetical protein
MVEGLLLHGVYVHRTGVAVHQAVILPLPILPDSAKAPSPRGYDAFPGTELALNLSVFQGLIMGGDLGSEEAFLSSLSRSRGRIAQNRPEESGTGAGLQKTPPGEGWSFSPCFIDHNPYFFRILPVRAFSTISSN